MRDAGKTLVELVSFEARASPAFQNHHFAVLRVAPPSLRALAILEGLALPLAWIAPSCQRASIAAVWLNRRVRDGCGVSGVAREEMLIRPSHQANYFLLPQGPRAGERWAS